MFVKNKSSEGKTVNEWAPNGSILDGLKDRLKRRWLLHRFNRYQATRPEGLDYFSQARTIGGYRVADALPEADIYNLHWVNQFVDPLPFFRKTKKPIVWTLHDMNPFTGGCHYNVGCTRYRRACGECPQLGSSDENDLSQTVWNRKQEAYHQAIEDGRLQIVAPSQWLAAKARRSALFSDAPVDVIPYGLDHTTFFPRETKGLQSALSIPADHRILLFVADSTRNRRKGFGLLKGALSGLTDQKVTLLSIGNHEPTLGTATSHVHLGRVQSDILLSVFYGFADLFLIPSRQDNLPNTVLESMACGTPVVGFNTGGIPDMVRPGETGWLAEVGNVRELRQSIEQALRDDDARRRMGRRCREIVETEYTLDTQARRYRTLYRKLVRPSSRPAQ
jgi:glycosyltransferase involved in cell wall biosynthesis